MTKTLKEKLKQNISQGLKELNKDNLDYGRYRLREEKTDSGIPYLIVEFVGKRSLEGKIYVISRISLEYKKAKIYEVGGLFDNAYQFILEVIQENSFQKLEGWNINVYQEPKGRYKTRSVDWDNFLKNN